VAETLQSLEGLASLKPAAPEAPKYEKKVTRKAAPMPRQAQERGRPRLDSSPAAARSKSTPNRWKSSSRGRCCAC